MKYWKEEYLSKFRGVRKDIFHFELEGVDRDDSYFASEIYQADLYDAMLKEAQEYFNKPSTSYRVQEFEKSCGNCKHLYYEYDEDHECKITGAYIKPNGICNAWEGE